MPSLQQRILDLVQVKPGLTDREITDILLGKGEPQQSINGMARMLERGGHVRRIKRPDGLIGNYAPGSPDEVDETPQNDPLPLPIVPEAKSKDLVDIRTPKPSARRFVSPLVTLLLIAAVTWLFFRVEEMKKDLAQAQANISTLKSGLAYITPIAENANRFAHSHNNFSDARLKTDIADIPNALDGVLALRGVRYQWNTTGFPEMVLDEGPQIGFIAQEVERVYPELVSTAPNGYKTVDYDRLTPILVEAIKQQQAEIKALQKRIVALEAQR